MKKLVTLFVILFWSLLLVACEKVANNNDKNLSENQSAYASNEVNDTSSSQLQQVLDEFLEKVFAVNPEQLTYLGLSDKKYQHYNSLLSHYDHKSDEKLTQLREEFLKKLGDINQQNLSLKEKTHIWVLENAVSFAQDREKFPYGLNSVFAVSSPYAITPISGAHIELPQLLLVHQSLKTQDDIIAFISRLSQMGNVISQIEAKIKSDAENGLILPDFALKNTIIGLEQFVETGVDKSSLVSVFAKKLAKILQMSVSQKNEYLAKVKGIVNDDIFPAYVNLANSLKQIKDKAPKDAGVWAQPQGDEYYKLALRNYGAGDMSAEDIHQLGLKEVKRIHAEMDKLLVSMGYVKGGVIARMLKATDKPENFYPDSDKGREDLLNDLRAQITAVTSKADKYFVDLPSYEVVVRRIPKYEEVAAPGGYYTSAAIDGSRPGTYWINLYDMDDWAKYRLKTLTYHEAVPGHHFQLSSQLDIKGFPLVRQLLFYSEYGEGWALYAEYLVKEMGMYENDPAGDLGRLQAELFRAGRLVVDTGLHYKRWSREEAIKWLHENTGEPINAVTREIERYAVWPGQATSYKLGMIKIQSLRAKAEAKLGNNFDIRTFHKLILSVGSVPLPVLEKRFDAWLADQQI